jgi:mRNA-degrading endonuclease toxin of MazEF toxin-antitoxin module
MLQSDCWPEVDHRRSNFDFRISGRRGPTVIEIPAGAGGLSKTSFAVCHQVTTLDRAKLSKSVGALPGEVLEEVELGLKAAMDLN